MLNREAFAALRLEDVGNAINYPDYLYPRRPVAAFANASVRTRLMIRRMKSK